MREGGKGWGRWETSVSFKNKHQVLNVFFIYQGRTSHNLGVVRLIGKLPSSAACILVEQYKDSYIPATFNTVTQLNHRSYECKDNRRVRMSPAANTSVRQMHKQPLKDKYSCILGVTILLCNNPVTLLISASDQRGY